MSAIFSSVRIYRLIIALMIAIAGLSAVSIVAAQPIEPREVRAPRFMRRAPSATSPPINLRSAVASVPSPSAAKGR